MPARAIKGYMYCPRERKTRKLKGVEWNLIQGSRHRDGPVLVLPGGTTILRQKGVMLLAILDDGTKVFVLRAPGAEIVIDEVLQERIFTRENKGIRVDTGNFISDQIATA